MAKTRTLKRIVLVLFAACILTAVFAGYSLFRISQEYQAGESDYEAIRSAFRTETTAPASQDSAPAAEPATDYAEVFRQMAETYPGLVAWVSIANTPIDYPVMQADDNNTYLNLTADGKQNSAGSIFLDCRNDSRFQDKNNILFGHALKNGKMFGSLGEYMDYAYWQAHPVITLITENGVVHYEIFAAYETTAGSESYTRTFTDESELQAYLELIQGQAAYSTGIEVTPEDSLLMLSTCTNRARERRYVVHARKKGAEAAATAPKSE